MEDEYLLQDKSPQLELAALYWHFVDIVWWLLFFFIPF
jgi:heme/copper-type cytochrome/quinol oxidase subunit 3